MTFGFMENASITDVYNLLLFFVLLWFCTGALLQTLYNFRIYQDRLHIDTYQMDIHYYSFQNPCITDIHTA